MIRVTPNEYLDRRRPEWLDAETLGYVRFDWHAQLLQGTRLVEILDKRKDIQKRMAAKCTNDGHVWSWPQRDAAPPAGTLCDCGLKPLAYSDAL